MLFFWRQPQYQSDLDLFLKKLLEDDPALSAMKESGFRQFWDQEPFDIDQYVHKKQAFIPQKADPYL